MAQLLDRIGEGRVFARWEDACGLWVARQGEFDGLFKCADYYVDERIAQATDVPFGEGPQFPEKLRHLEGTKNGLKVVDIELRL